jgi:hypothetical protein
LRFSSLRFNRSLYLSQEVKNTQKRFFPACIKASMYVLKHACIHMIERASTNGMFCTGKFVSAYTRTQGLALISGEQDPNLQGHCESNEQTHWSNEQAHWSNEHVFSSTEWKHWSNKHHPMCLCVRIY